MEHIDYEIIRCESLKTTEWSGGTTTEICIHPENSRYADRNFGFRISSALVADDESTFTLLPGYKRHIMPLVGNMHLTHENRHEVELKPFDKDFFHGDWVTKSKGKCMDFNLMLSDEFEGSIDPVKSGDLEVFGADGFFGFYILADCKAMVTQGSEMKEETLGKGDFLAFPFIDNQSNKMYQVKLVAQAGNDVNTVKVIVKNKQCS